MGDFYCDLLEKINFVHHKFVYAETNVHFNVKISCPHVIRQSPIKDRFMQTKSLSLYKMLRQQ